MSKTKKTSLGVCGRVGCDEPCKDGSLWCSDKHDPKKALTHILVVGQGGWAKGEDPRKTLRSAKGYVIGTPKHYMVWRCGAKTYLDDIGRICGPAEELEPVFVAWVSPSGIIISLDENAKLG